MNNYPKNQQINGKQTFNQLCISKSDIRVNKKQNKQKINVLMKISIRSYNWVN